MNTLLTNMKIALVQDATLAPYLGDAVEVREWDPERLPDFDIYCVVLSPRGVQERAAGVLGIEKTFPVLIVCLVRNFGLPAALTGADLQDGYGLIKLTDDVVSVLRGNELSGSVIANSVVLEAASQIGQALERSAHVLSARIEYSGRRRVQVNE